MNFSSMLARKYIFTQKRHSLLTVLSIAAAVTLITVIFTVFSTFWSCMKNIAANDDPWHATVTGLDRDQARELAENGFIDHYRYSETKLGFDDEDGKPVGRGVMELMFDKKTEDPYEQTAAALAKMGLTADQYWDPNIPDVIAVSINKDLLKYEVIGLDAKYELIQKVALLYFFVMFIVFCARFVIDTAFEISSKEREKQYGILRSIGASKKQIVNILLFEGGYLSIVGVPLGLGFGIVMSYVIYRLVLTSRIVESVTSDPRVADQVVRFTVWPLLVLITAVTGIVWALLSAYGTGMRAAKMSPIEAIRSRGTVVAKVRRKTFGGLVFGWAGKLAARNIRRSKKRFIITILSVTLSITLFVGFTYVIDLYSRTMEEAFELNASDFWVEVYDSLIYEVDPESYVKPVPGNYKDYEKELKASGHFKHIRPRLEAYGHIVRNDYDYESYRSFIQLYFVTEETYDRMFPDKSDIPYSRLNSDNAFVFINGIDNFVEDISDTVDIKLTEHSTFFDEPIETEDEFGDMIWTFEEKKEPQIETVKVLEHYDTYSDSFAAIGEVLTSPVLIGTVEQYDSYWNKYSMSEYYTNFMLDLADSASYPEAISFLRTNYGWTDVPEDEDYAIMDFYGANLTIKRTISAVTIFAYSFDALIAVIAIINMVNIISTGIINRRSEIAAMKSLGMNKRQLNKMLVLECFGYVSIAGVISALIGALMFFATMRAMVFFDFQTGEYMFDMFDHFKPLLSIIPMMLAALIVGCIATAIPLRRINKDPITESMRSVD